MDRRYTILALLLIMAAAGLLILPDTPFSKEISPEKMLTAIDDPSRFLSTDLITERIIGGNPSLQLIDVRKPEQFTKYALPGAVNIPLDSLCSSTWKPVFDQPGKDRVFYSNDDILADQAWQLCKRQGMERIFVMKGGLNYWFKTIIKGDIPPASAPSEDFDLYTFRLAARQFFTGVNLNGDDKEIKKTPVQPKKVNVEQKKSESSGGGC